MIQLDIITHKSSILSKFNIRKTMDINKVSKKYYKMLSDLMIVNGLGNTLWSVVYNYKSTDVKLFEKITLGFKIDILDKTSNILKNK